jgi:membrane associated rhomboid family serine protease
MRLSGRKPSSLTRTWTPRSRAVLLGLIGLNVTTFFGQLFLEAYQPGFVHDFLGLSDQGLHDAYSWQFLTAMFIHNGPWHLVGNMLLFYLVGRDVESIIGQRQFLLLYLAGALGGELSHLFLMPSDSVLFGASGGVIAIVVAYATILPELELTSLIFPFLPLRLKAKHMAYGAFAIAIIGLIIDREGAVSRSAYLGGCVAGWLYAHLLGFGRPSILQRTFRQHRTEIERYQLMSAEQFISEEVDPVLDKIAREGMQSLTWAERRTLALARDKIVAKKKTR